MVSHIDPGESSPGLNEKERALRDLFVQEYMKDYDAFNACLRVGFQATYALEYSQQFLRESYVQQRIKACELQSGLREEDSERLVLSVLRREMQYTGPGSSHAARVSAAGLMAKLLGLEAPSRTQNDVNINSPIQFYLPDNGRDSLYNGCPG